MTNEAHSIDVPNHLTKVEIVGQIGGYRHAKQIIGDELESWLDEHVSYAVSHHHAFPVLIVYSDDDRALIKLTWGF